MVLIRSAAVMLLVAPAVAFLSSGAAQTTKPPIAYISDGGGALDIWVADASGQNQRKLTDSRSDNINPTWSPNAKRIAWASTRNGAVNLYVMNADGSGQHALTTNKRRSSSNPAWSPNGKLIAFETNRDGNWEIYVMNADGSKHRNVSRDGDDDFGPSWAPDSQRLVYQRTNARRSWLVITDVLTLKPRALPTPGPAADAVWSPNGKLIAFDAFVNKNYDIWLTNPNGKPRRRLTTSPAEDTEPTFSPDSTSVAFTSTRDDNYELYSTDLLGRLQVNLTETQHANELDPDWAPTSPRARDARSRQHHAANARLSCMQSARTGGGVITRTTKAGPLCEPGPNAGWSCTKPASSGDHVITGTSNADTLCGTPFGETINALAGNDRLVGKSGRDRHWGGPGGDKFWTHDCFRDYNRGSTPKTSDTSRVDLSHRDTPPLDVEFGIDGHF